MNRFKIIEKQILSYRDGGLPTQLEMEFRTWDDRSAIYGLGLRASPGNITHLSVSGRTLDESTGILGGPVETAGSADQVEVNIGPPSEVPSSEVPFGGGHGGGHHGDTIFVLTGLGFSVTGKDPAGGSHQKPCHMAGMKIWTVDISRGYAIGPQPHPQGPNGCNGTAPTRAYMVGSGVEREAVLKMECRLLATNVTTRADPGNVTKAWAEWGTIKHGSEVSVDGLLASVEVRVDSQRVELSLVSGDPIGWYFDLNESLSTQMLLLSHAREGVVHGTHVRLAGVKWDKEASAELETITLLGS